MTRKEVKYFIAEKAEDLENELGFLTVKNIFFRKLSD